MQITTSILFVLTYHNNDIFSRMNKYEQKKADFFELRNALLLQRTSYVIAQNVLYSSAVEIFHKCCFLNIKASLVTARSVACLFS